MSSLKNQSANRFHNIFGDVENVFHHFFEGQKPAAFQPRWDVSETEKQYQLVLELPGLKPEEVNVEVEQQVLTVSGEKSITRDNDDQAFHAIERVAGPFRRSIEFTAPIDSEKVEATFENGLLTVTVSKSEKALPRKIQIKS